jgi:hypothetical protein
MGAFDPISPATSFDEGGQATQNAVDRFRKNAAFNALQKIYGPIAGDPDSATKLQEYGQKEKLNPLLIQQQELTNTGTDLSNTGQEQTNALNQQLNPLKVEEAQIGNKQSQQNLEQTGALFPTKLEGAQLQNQGQALQNTGQSIANTTGQQTQDIARSVQERQAAAGIVAALSDTAQQGGDVGALFDRYAPIIAKMEGTDPSHLTDLRAALVKDPVGTINALQSALQAAQNAAPTRPGVAKPAVQTNAEKAGALEVIRERTQAVPQALDSAMALLPQMSNSAVLRKAQANIPGTPEYKFVQLTHQIGANLSLDDLRAVRASGLSLGRTNIAEFQASANAFANNDLGQDPSQLAANLKRLKGSYAQINSNIDSDIKRLKGGGLVAAQPKAKASPAQLLDSHGGNLDAAIAAAPDDATATAVADEYERRRGTTPTGGKAKTAPLSDKDLLAKYGVK